MGSLLVNRSKPIFDSTSVPSDIQHVTFFDWLLCNDYSTLCMLVSPYVSRQKDSMVNTLVLKVPCTRPISQFFVLLNFDYFYFSRSWTNLSKTLPLILVRPLIFFRRRERDMDYVQPLII